MWLHGIQKSDRKDKKYKAKFCLCEEFDKCKGKNTKDVYFGATGYEDFTEHQDPKRRENYLKRHKKNENWNKPDTPGALSRWILWDSTSLGKNIASYRKRFFSPIINKH